jgi:hypothetical protein
MGASERVPQSSLTGKQDRTRLCGLLHVQEYLECSPAAF